MKVYQGENEYEISTEGTPVRNGDRWLIRTPQGVYSGVKVQSRGKAYVSFRGYSFEVSLNPPPKTSGSQKLGGLNAVMPGVIVAILVSTNEDVLVGQKLGVLEAMKTQQPILSPFAGKVTKVLVQEGEQVGQDQPLFEVEPLEEAPSD